jgi:hypothetical protein
VFRVTRAFAVVVSTLLVATSAAAQTSTGGIRGFVRDDSGGVLAGVTVEATSPARIGGAAVEVTDGQGLYNFQNLPSGDYTVSYTLQGFSTVRREGIRVEVGRTIEVDIEMAVGAVTESITVVGQSPVVDALHAGTSTTFNQELLQNVPTARQSYFDIVTYSPAVRINQVPNDSRFIIFGSSSDQNQFQYDGVDISAVSNGGVWDFPSPDIMQEIQVKAIGASAEYHDFQGGVVNIITKTGSNNYRGAGTYYVIPPGLVGNNTPNEQFPYKVHYNHQTTVEVGGPIARDRVWFYGILPYNRGLTTGVGVDPNLDKVGGSTYKPFAKGTVKFTDRDVLNVGWNNNMFCCGATASRTTPLLAQTVEHGHNPVLTSNYSRTLGNATLLEVRVGGIYIRDNFTPHSDDFSTSGRSDDATGFSSVNGQNASKQFHNRTSVDASLAHTVSELLGGTHDFKVGIQSALATQRTVSMRIGGVSYTDLAGAPYLATYSDPSASGGRIRTFGGYFQDNWTANDRLTLNLGVRFDAARADIPELSAQATLDGVRGASFDLDGPTYEAVSDLIGFNTVSPRVGLTLRLDSAGRSVFKTSYGRFYGKLATSMFNSASPGAAPQTTLRWDPATQRYSIPFSFVDNRVNFAVDPSLKNQYTDQVFAGIEQQLMGDMGLTVSFVWKQEADFIRLKDVRGTYAPITVNDTFMGSTQQLTVFNLTSPQSQRLFQVTNRDDFDQEFKSVVFELNKRFSQSWQALASYTWQDSKAFGSGAVTGSTQQDFSNLSSTGGFGRDPNDLVNAFGPTATNSTHAVKLSTNYRAPYDINLGARYSYESGRPYGRLIIVRGLGQGNVTMLAEPRTAYALPEVNDFQFRVDKSIRFGNTQRVRVSLDLFNVLNSDTVLTLRNNSSQVTATTPWAQTLSIVRPRAAQIGLRYEF